MMSERHALFVQFGAYGLAVMLSMVALVNFSFDLVGFAQGTFSRGELKASAHYWIYYFLIPAAVLWLVGRLIAFVQNAR